MAAARRRHTKCLFSISTSCFNSLPRFSSCLALPSAALKALSESSSSACKLATCASSSPMMRSRLCSSRWCESSFSRKVAFSMRVAARVLVTLRGEENSETSEGPRKADLCASRRVDQLAPRRESARTRLTSLSSRVGEHRARPPVLSSDCEVRPWCGPSSRALCWSP